MQLNLELFEDPDAPRKTPPSWELVDEAARNAAIEILARLITRMLQEGPAMAKEARDERAL
jgi:hypothetical protein